MPDTSMVAFLAAPFVASLILTGIHAYLGVHVVERGVILSRGSSLEIPLAELKHSSKVANNINGSTTLEVVERDHILRVLGESSWVIGGPTGAAARLGLNRTTLNHRMRKLGINRPQPQQS